MCEKIKNLKIGDSAVVVGFDGGSEEYRNRILSMGISKNTEIKVTKKAPLGDPVEIEVRSYKLTLRKEEAEIIKLERIK